MIIKGFIIVGQLATIASPATNVAQQVVKTQQQKQYNMGQLVPVTKFSGFYKNTKADYLKLIKEAKNTFSDFNVSLKDAAKFYDENPEKANAQIEKVNMMFAKRGFWSSVGSFFKSMGHTIASAGTAVAAIATFGKVPSVNRALASEVKKTKKSWENTGKEIATKETGEDTLHIISGILNVIAATKDVSNAGEHLASATEDFGATAH